MKKEFVPYELAVKLKALGFDEDCLARYEGKIKHIEKPLVFEFTFANLPGAQNKVEYPNYPYKDVEAPTFSQAFRWFREKYQLNGLLNHYPNTKEWDCSVHNLNWSGKELMEYMKTEDRSVKYSTYEEAELACLDKLLEIVEFKSE